MGNHKTDHSLQQTVWSLVTGAKHSLFTPFRCIATAEVKASH
ncbi:hypothetical protein DMW06_16700 [Vibrio parahaemolyticus]|nr:hypothetical protein [Vibrio parahaemolyticus]